MVMTETVILTFNDPTVVLITPSSMEVTKSVTVLENGDGTLGVGDTVKYLIKVQNTGNVNLTGPTLVDTFTDASGKVINLMVLRLILLTRVQVRERSSHRRVLITMLHS